MECNFDYKTFCRKDCVHRADYEVQAENEFILADYYSPIKKVLNYSVEPAVSTKNVVGNMISVDGIAGLKLIYIDDNDDLCSFETSFVFSKNIECDNEIKDSKIKCYISAEKVTLRVVTDRKIELRGNMTLSVAVFEIKHLKLLCPVSDEHIEQKCEKIPLKETILFADKNIILEEDIELSDSHAEVNKIINYSAKVIPEASKIMNGKVMLKGNIAVCVTYLSNEGIRAYKIEQKIPYSSVCDIHGIDERFECESDERLIFLEVKCRNNGYDDQRTLIVNAKMCISVEATLNTEEEFVLDMYSTNSEMVIESAQVELKKDLEKICESFSVKKSLEFSEDTIGSVIDIMADVAYNGFKINEGTVQVFGTVYIKMIVCDVDNSIQYIERAIDFEHKTELRDKEKVVDNDILLCLSNLSYVITSDTSVDVMCEITASMKAYNVCDKKIVVSAKKEADYVKKDECAVFVSYIEGECDIWSIAKKYKSSVSEILAFNKLDSSQKYVSGPLIIPVK